MKLLITVFVIVGALYGAYHFTMAAYGWLEMSSIVDEAAKAEVPALVDRMQQGGFAALDTRDRVAVKLRETIMKGAKEYKVPLRADDVVITIADNMLDVRLTWDAPVAVFNGKNYLEIPISLQRAFSLTKRP